MAGEENTVTTAGVAMSPNLAASREITDALDELVALLTKHCPDTHDLGVVMWNSTNDGTWKYDIERIDE